MIRTIVDATVRQFAAYRTDGVGRNHSHDSPHPFGLFRADGRSNYGRLVC